MIRMVLALALAFTGLACAKGAIGPVDTTKHYEDVNRQGETDLDVQTRMADATEEMTTYTQWNLAFGIVTGLGVLFIGWITWRSGGRQWEASHKATQTELRAYVHIIATGLNKQYIDVKPSATLEIKNLGQTPCRDVRIWSKLQRLPIGSNPEVPKHPPYSPIVDLGPTMLFIHSVQAEEVLTQSDFNTMFHNTPLTHELFIWGRIVYRDRFENFYRFTDFQMVINKESFAHVDSQGKVNIPFRVTPNAEKNQSI